MKPQGICLRERTMVTFPDGSIRQGAIWQHTEGVRGIYAIAPDEEGMLNAFALEPVWVVRSGENGQAVWQGMGVTNWLVEFWAGLKVLLSKGRTKIYDLINNNQLPYVEIPGAGESTKRISALTLNEWIRTRETVKHAS